MSSRVNGQREITYRDPENGSVLAPSGREDRFSFAADLHQHKNKDLKQKSKSDEGDLPVRRLVGGSI